MGVTGVKAPSSVGVTGVEALGSMGMLGVEALGRVGVPGVETPGSVGLYIAAHIEAHFAASATWKMTIVIFQSQTYGWHDYT